RLSPFTEAAFPLRRRVRPRSLRSWPDSHSRTSFARVLGRIRFSLELRRDNAPGPDPIPALFAGDLARPARRALLRRQARASMAGVKQEIVIDAPPRACYDTVVDYEKYPTYMPEMKEVVILEREGT